MAFSGDKPNNNACQSSSRDLKSSDEDHKKTYQSSPEDMLDLKCSDEDHKNTYKSSSKDKLDLKSSDEHPKKTHQNSCEHMPDLKSIDEDPKQTCQNSCEHMLDLKSIDEDHKKTCQSGDRSPRYMLSLKTSEHDYNLTCQTNYKSMLDFKSSSQDNNQSYLSNFKDHTSSEDDHNYACQSSTKYLLDLKSDEIDPNEACQSKSKSESKYCDSSLEKRARCVQEKVALYPVKIDKELHQSYCVKNEETAEIKYNHTNAFGSNLQDSFGNNSVEHSSDCFEKGLADGVDIRQKIRAVETSLSAKRCKMMHSTTNNVTKTSQDSKEVCQKIL